ncbi:L-threonylcarbamoyladenylate synthase [Oxalobacter vibrioformis]|uniref:L-threonylcarbamoyladenylate synthase n=1 Tax=Oxalobacter vibrioformis TaxID=933080 RepID=A0A9E9LXC9_9BURK|nr:L-threonylcarbamoyladenylate synthase [Oxalobacter vibrioformis]NLC23226.1 threonylcarbamoyl-AMP synthase [Oxalobacter sp.]WAW10442.1 L-threonylcarbamoyladenylate synthase [Oxalobacter vibrioformis]
MSQFFQIHPDNPQQRLIRRAAEIVRKGGIIAVPTESCYVLACRLEDKSASDRLRQIRQVDEKHHLTLMCRDLSEIGSYAKVDNSQFRMLKAAMPGSFTFILEATKEVPRRLSHPSRKTIGIRVPDNRIMQMLLEEVGEPLLGTTLILPGETDPLTDPEVINEKLKNLVDVVVDGGACSFIPTTVIDMTDKEPVLVRKGGGDAAVFGL